MCKEACNVTVASVTFQTSVCLCVFVCMAYAYALMLM